MSKLTRKVAVVTLAFKGIGAAIAKSLVAEGAAVIVNYASSKAGADAVVRNITAAGGNAVAVGGDVSKAAEVQGLIDAAIKNFARLDIPVNNSGIYEFAPTTQAATKHLYEGSSISNIGSGVSRITPPNSAVYTATKGVLGAITGVLAKELGAKKIRVNSVNPGIVETEGRQSAGFSASDFEKALVSKRRSVALANLMTLPGLSPSQPPRMQSGLPANP